MSHYQAKKIASSSSPTKDKNLVSMFQTDKNKQA